MRTRPLVQLMRACAAAGWAVLVSNRSVRSESGWFRRASPAIPITEPAVPVVSVSIEASAPIEAIDSQPGRFFALPLGRLPWWAKGLALVVVLAIGGVAAYYGATRHPDLSPPAGSELEAAVAHAFGRPSETQDSTISGDLLVERFYLIDAETGERYVADMLKGRIRSIVTATRENETQQYVLLLDLQNLQRDRALYTAFVTAITPPAPSEGYYLGLRVQGGVSDGFPLNYDGSLPASHEAFRSPEDEDIGSYLSGLKLSKVDWQMIDVDGYHYLRGSTELLPHIRTEFGISKGIFVSELMVVDATGRPQAATFYRLLEQYQSSQAR